MAFVGMLSDGHLKFDVEGAVRGGQGEFQFKGDNGFAARTVSSPLFLEVDSSGVSASTAAPPQETQLAAAASMLPRPVPPQLNEQVLAIGTCFGRDQPIARP